MSQHINNNNQGSTRKVKTLSEYSIVTNVEEVLPESTANTYRITSDKLEDISGVRTSPSTRKLGRIYSNGEIINFLS